MKIKFLKGIAYKTDGGLMRTSKAGEVVEFFNESSAEEILDGNGFAMLLPEHFPSRGRYQIAGPWPLKIEGESVSPGAVVTLTAEVAAGLCSKRQAVPLDEGLWVPGRRSASLAKKLYSEE